MMEETNKYKSSDEHLRSRFAEAELQPSAKSWDEVEKRLDDKGKKRPGYIYWLSGLLLLMMTGGTMWYFKQNADLDKSLAAIDKTAGSAIVQPKNPLSQNASAEETKPETTTTNLTKNEVVTTEKNPPTQNATAGKEEKEKEKTETKTETKKEIPTTNQTFTDASVAMSSNEQKAIAKALEKKYPTTTKTTASNDETTIQKNPIAEAIKNPPSLKASEDKQEANKKSTSKDSSSFTVTAAKTTPPEKLKTTESTTEQKKTARPTGGMEVQPIVKADSIAPVVVAASSKKIESDSASAKKDSVKTVVAAMPPLPKKDSIKPEEEAASFSKIISLYFSPDYYQNKIQDNSTQGIKDEKQVMRYSAGLKFSYVVLDKLTVRLGIAYSELKQQLEQHKIYFDRYMTTPFIFHSSLGDMAVDPDVMRNGFPPTAPPFITQFFTGYTYTQKVQFIHIPLELKYGFNFKHIGISVIAGVNAQYAISQHAELDLIKENNTDVVTYNNLNINKLSFSGSAGLSVDFKLSKHLSLFLEPNARMNFTPISKSPVVRSTPYFFGANAGVGFHF